MVRVAIDIAPNPVESNGSSSVRLGDILEIIGMNADTVRVRYPIGVRRSGPLAFNIRRELIEPLTANKL